jgi:GTP cyclohydrolase I
MTGDDVHLAEWIERVSPHAAEQVRLSILDNPNRITAAYREILGGSTGAAIGLLKVTRKVDPEELVGPVNVTDMPFFSTCAHHFLPFFGTCDLTYIPGDTIIGLGKIPRFVDVFSRQCWIQEDLTCQLATTFGVESAARSVEVTMRATHLCMLARGPRSSSITTTSCSWRP